MACELGEDCVVGFIERALARSSFDDDQAEQLTRMHDRRDANVGVAAIGRSARATRLRAAPVLTTPEVARTEASDSSSGKEPGPRSGSETTRSSRPSERVQSSAASSTKRAPQRFGQLKEQLVERDGARQTAHGTFVRARPATDARRPETFEMRLSLRRTGE